MHQGAQGDPSFLCAGVAILNFLLLGASQDVPKHPWCLLWLAWFGFDLPYHHSPQFDWHSLAFTSFYLTVVGPACFGLSLIEL